MCVGRRVWYLLPHTLSKDMKKRKGKKVGTYFASNAKAMIPATMGAETEVPVWPSVQW